MTTEPKWQACSVRDCTSTRRREPWHRERWWWVCSRHVVAVTRTPSSTLELPAEADA
jgi:hypothetical protein